MWRFVLEMAMIGSAVRLLRRSKRAIGVSFALLFMWGVWWLTPVLPRLTLAGKLRFDTFSPDGRSVVTSTIRGEGNASITGPVEIWDVATGSRLASYGPEFEAPTVVFSPDGELMADVHRARGEIELTVHDAATAKELATMKTYFLHSLKAGWGRIPVVFSADSQTLAFLGPGGEEMLLWDRASASIRATFKCRWGMAISSDGRFAATSFAEAQANRSEFRLVVWDTASRRELRSFTLGAERPYAVALSDDGKLVAAAKRNANHTSFADTEQIDLWEVDSGRLLATIYQHFDPRSLQFVGRDRLIKAWFLGVAVWDLRSVPPEPVLPQSCLDVASSADGNLLAYSNAAQILNANASNLFSPAQKPAEPPPPTITIWDISARQPRLTITPRFPAGSATVLSFAKDGQSLAVQGTWRKDQVGWLATIRRWTQARFTQFPLDGEVQLLEVATGRCLGRLEGEVQATISPDGRTIAAPGIDDRVRLYDLPLHKPWRLILSVWATAGLVSYLGRRRLRARNASLPPPVIYGSGGDAPPGDESKTVEC